MKQSFKVLFQRAICRIDSLKLLVCLTKSCRYPGGKAGNAGMTLFHPKTQASVWHFTGPAQPVLVSNLQTQNYFSCWNYHRDSSALLGLKSWNCLGWKNPVRSSSSSSTAYVPRCPKFCTIPPSFECCCWK